MKRRILYIAICLLAMIPAAMAYAGGGLLSGCPSSANVGDTITCSVDPGDEEGDLDVSISPSSGASLDVNGNSFKVTFTEAGTYTITAKIGDEKDSCTITVKEQESSDDTGGDEGEGDSDAEGTDGEGTEDEGTDGESTDDEDAGTEDEEEADGPVQGGRQGGMPSSGKSGDKGSFGSVVASGGSGSVSSSGTTDTKTVYAGSWNNYLESLTVDGYEFSQTFHKTNDTYFMTVTSDVDSVDVDAEPEDDDAEVVITGTEDLSTGRNKIMVSVTAENGDVRVYRIYVDVK